jgi:putative tricarboxylic transport membrane protein
MGFPLGLPLTLALSPQAGRGDRAAPVARALPLLAVSVICRGGFASDLVSYEWGGTPGPHLGSAPMQEGGTGQGPAWGETIVGLAVLTLAAVVAWQTTVIPDNAIYAQVGPKVIPWIATAMLAVLGALLTLWGVRGGWAHEEQGPAHLWGAFWLLLGLALNVALIGAAGFIIASTVLFVCTALAFGSRSVLRDAAIGFALALIAYVGFDRVLGYKIGSGLIEGLL